MQIAAQTYIFTKLPNVAARQQELLKQMSDAGYAAAEMMYSLPPVRRSDWPLAMRCVGPHLVPPDMDRLDRLLAYCTSQRCHHVISSGPLQWNSRTADDFRKTAHHLNAIGRQLRDAGITLCYHNHEFEFAPLPCGQTVMDLLASEFDPQAVSFCLDIGWAWIAGLDPVPVLRRYSSQIALVHLRDFAGQQSVPLGAGQIDLSSAIDSIRDIGTIETLCVEQDPTSADPVADMLTSRRYLATHFGL